MFTTMIIWRNTPDYYLKFSILDLFDPEKIELKRLHSLAGWILEAKFYSL